MQSEFTVPNSKILELFQLIKKVCKKNEMNSCKIHFTPKGLVAIPQTGIQLVVPVSLNIDKIFVMACGDITELQKLDSEGDVTFLIRELDEELRAMLSPSNDRTKIESWERAVSITYKEKGITKQFVRLCDFDITGVNFYTCDIPTEMIVESSKFLSAFAACVPFCDDEYNSKYVLGSVCFKGDFAVATDGKHLIVVKNVDMLPLPPNSKTFEKGLFLLPKNIAAFLPKSGTCSLAFMDIFMYDKYLISSTNKKTLCLGIKLPDYQIYVSIDEDLKYPNWEYVIPDRGENATEFRIDPRDAQVILKQIKLLPQSRDKNIIQLYVDDGRLCVASTLDSDYNTCLRLSEYSVVVGDTKKIHYFNMLSFRQVLSISSTFWTNFSETSEPFVFESGDILVVQMPETPNTWKGIKEVTNVVNVQDYWEVEKPAKKAESKKQTQLSSLFVNAEYEMLAALRLENEELKKENERLRQLRDTKINSVGL
jgi:hypothetical protein